MKVILFSPNGYVGSNIKERLDNDNDIELTEITRESNLDIIGGSYDILIYSASITSARNADAEQYIKDNALCAVKMVNFCKKHLVKRIIYLSSDEIYGRLWTNQVTELVEMHSPNIYGITKYLAEKVIMESGISYYILRLPGIVGRKWGNNFLYRLIDSISRNETVYVYQADKDFNNIVEVDDLIDFIIKLMYRKDYLNSEVFLLGNSKMITMRNLADYVKHIYNSRSEIVYAIERGNRYFTLNIQKALKYGYHSKDIKKIIEELKFLQKR